MTSRPRNPTMACPHCAHRLIVRGSEQITLTVRELRMECDECGASLVGQLSLIRVRRNSSRHNPEVMLPFSNPALQWDRRKPANDDAPIPANDDGVVTADRPERAGQGRTAAPLRPG